MRDGLSPPPMDGEARFFLQFLLKSAQSGKPLFEEFGRFWRTKVAVSFGLEFASDCGNCVFSQCLKFSSRGL
jgi:hypothetical protein